MLTPLRCVASVALACLIGSSAFAEQVLFIGNSFTRSIPTTLQRVAKAKDKTFESQVIAKSATAWKYHLTQANTIAALGEKKWDYVVIQDLSSEPTHIGNVKQFMEDGEKFYRHIREKAPQAKVVLYQTWAYATGSNTYTGESTPKTFTGPEEMSKELIENYTALAKKLEALEPGQQVLLAPVGAAFEACRKQYPDVDLQGDDDKHASDTGKYLASLVLYATLYNDSPVGPSPTPGVKVPADVATNLQKLADDAVKAVAPAAK